MSLKETISRYLTPNRGLYLYIFILLATCLYYLSQWSIVALDNDLWYHLNGGRFILEQKSLPRDSFFSFITPARQWVNYYWLFQVVAYGIYSLWEYYGLIFLRAVIFMITMALILIYLLRKQERKEGRLFLVSIFSLYLLFLLGRAALIRPHLFSYLFIIAFLYIIELRPKMMGLLPVLAALWCNLHGVEYPVMLLILCSFILEFFIEHLKNRQHLQNKELYYIISLVLSMAAIFFTPHGLRLIEIPFTSTTYASQYIAELRLLTLKDLVTFHVSLIGPTYTTIFNLIMILAGISLITAIAKGKLKIHHLVLFMGGVILLTKANRFMYEFVLLALPIFRAHPLGITLRNLNNKMKWLGVVTIVVILFLPFFWLRSFFSNQPRYPFSNKDLPQGVVTFLNRIPAGGYLLNQPGNGGYFQWMLYPKYKIFMDLEVPFLFTDEDYFIVANAFYNETVLGKVLSKYHPSFISVSIHHKGFKDLINKFPDYTLIFFDSEEVLYVSKDHYPAIAQEFELKNPDPFELVSSRLDSILQKTDEEALIRNLEKLVGIYPDCLMTNRILATIFILKKDYDRALNHIKHIIHNFPENPTGYSLQGDALKGLNLYDEALSSYREALARVDEKGKPDIYKLMSSVYMRTKQYAKAYEVLKKSIGIFVPETTHIDLFNLSSAALLAGRTDEAVTLLKFAGKKIPPQDTEWQNRIREQLSRLGVQTE